MSPRKLFATLLVAAAVAVSVYGCTTTRDECPECNPYLPQTSPNNVLKNLATAYKSRDIDQYAKLLAEDFQFYFDPDTRAERGLPEFWNRVSDSTFTGRVFSSPEVNDIRITLTYSPTPEPVTEIGREHWVLINVNDEYLEVEQKAAPGETEGITLVVDGQIQKFYFRRGYTEDDTLQSSKTKDLYFITEWRDQGVQ